MTNSVATPRYLVGIDLGTTHTVVAYTDTQAKNSIQLFEIEQLVAPGEVAAKRLLPSVRYHPASEELAEQDTQLPWLKSSTDTHAILGQWARVLGAKSQGRLVVSAKSWLSHAAVDRTA
ncbi:MAG: molecular chaperone DnaK, partial [Methylococcales bacterium]|nr:molecular chaperone DnaK [Methylococcales bacterium]